MQPNGIGSSARRISIVGSTGSGKTYLGRILSRQLSLPHCELDDIRSACRAGSHAQVEFLNTVGELVEQDEWLIDGHYRDVRHLIWARADMVVHLNYSLPVIGARLLSRFFNKSRIGRRTARGVTVSDSDLHRGANSHARASWSRRIGRLAKTVRERGEYTRILHGPVYRDLLVLELKSPRATDQWLASVERSPANRETLPTCRKESR